MLALVLQSTDGGREGGGVQGVNDNNNETHGGEWGSDRRANRDTWLPTVTKKQVQLLPESSREEG